MQIKKYIVGITNCKAAPNQQSIRCFLYDENISFYQNCYSARIKIISAKIISETSKKKAKNKFIEICQRR